LGRLRLGFLDKTILDALSWMLAGDKSKRETIEAAYNLQTDVGLIAQMIKAKGLKSLKSLKVQIGVPIMPALCQRLPTAKKIIEKMGRVAGEPKFDGTRLQIHFSLEKKWTSVKDQLAFDFQPKGFVRFFTRNLENVTAMFPDLVQAVFEEVEAKEAILDGEAIGFDTKTGKFLPFQETIKRKRKYGIGRKAKEIPLKFFVFDLLFKNGRSFLRVSFEKRRRVLEQTVMGGKTILLAPQIVTQDPIRLKKYHQKQLNKGLEGIVAKKWHSFYDPGKRGYTWVKLKHEKGKKGGGLADTLDCVVMGYYQGRGKRAKFGIGMFLVGIQNRGKIFTVSKIGTGLTDDQWREMKKRCEKVKTKKKPKEYQVDKNLAPDVWCEPKIMVEIEADNITRSPIHTARHALRFPRLVRFRDDKSPAQSTTLKEIKKLFELQK